MIATPTATSAMGTNTGLGRWRISSATALIWVMVLVLRSGADVTLSRGDRAKDRDDQLAREDHNDDPRCDEPLLDQHDQDGQHKQLVRERIQEFAEVAHGAATARELAVQ